MTRERCPACDAPFEYTETETSGPGDEAPAVTLEVDDLCAVDPETRWDRICLVATAAAAEDVEGDGPELRTYRHHWPSTEAQG